MSAQKPLRVAALIDLPRSPRSGGHVKCWERLAQVAAHGELPLDLTLYFSGRETLETLGPKARIRQLPPVFSTSRLKFLPYVPDHTDLAPYHLRLARELPRYDIIHCTDGFFAFARTAENVSRRHQIPLVTSFHTDTPSYTEIFTRHTLETMFGKSSWLSHKLINDWGVPRRKREGMMRRLTRHLQACQHAIVTRAEDEDFATALLSPARVHHLRLGIDREMFGPHRERRAAVESDYHIPSGRLLILFVGRLDVGKNIHTLIAAMETLLAAGLPLHLIAAGIGPAEEDLKRRLGSHVSVPGFVEPSELGRLFASVDALALTSEVEMRSMVGVEAMASGCPVLVADKSGVAQLFHRTPAMKVVAGGAEAWAEAIREIATSPELRQYMRAEALDYDEAHLAGWKDVLAEDLFAVWCEAANQRKAELTSALQLNTENARFIWSKNPSSGAASG